MLVIVSENKEESLSSVHSIFFEADHNISYICFFILGLDPLIPMCENREYSNFWGATVSFVMGDF